jgi:spore coat protein U-like protein
MRAWTVAVLAGLLVAVPSVRAAQSTVPFTASASVVRGCAVTATTLDFGTYAAGTFAPTVLATSTISVTCALGDTFTIGLDDGSNASGAQRRMARLLAPINYLNYNLYRDAARTQAWGDAGPTRASGIGTGTAQVFTVYGQLPGAQVVLLGAYADTVTVVVRN